MARKLALKLVLAVIPALLLVTACGGGEPPAPTTPPAAKPANGAPAKAGDAAAGQTVFQQNCDGCHPGGNAGTGPALRGRGLTAERISTQVRNGGGGMPAFPPNRISDQQLADVVAYVMSLQ